MKTDYERLMQCILCENDPERCGCTDADENEHGMCTKYKGRKGETKMQITENRAKQQKQIIDKIQSVFDNAEYIVQFQFEINGGVGMNTRIQYTVVENLVDEEEN